MELPLVTPEQIIASRNIYSLFTGDLHATFDSFPSFPGEEQHRLKAMLVRISFSSFIGNLITSVPKGIYKLNDESGEIEFEEEWKIPDLAELGTLESWHHFHPNILNAGRVTHFVDPNLNEEVFVEFRIGKPKLTVSMRSTL